MNKKILFLFLALLIFIPFVSFAQVTLQGIVESARDNLIPLAAALSTIAFIVAGVMFLTATGNPSRMAIAKGSLIAAVTGIVIIVLAESADAFVKTFFGL